MKQAKTIVTNCVDWIVVGCAEKGEE